MLRETRICEFNCLINMLQYFIQNALSFRDVKVSKDTREQVRARGARGSRRGDRGRGGGGASTHVTTPQQQEYGIFSYGTGGDGSVKKRFQGKANQLRVPPGLFIVSKTNYCSTVWTI